MVAVRCHTGSGWDRAATCFPPSSPRPVYLEGLVHRAVYKLTSLFQLPPVESRFLLGPEQGDLHVTGLVSRQRGHLA
jgi:hypothetical protein